MMSVSKISIVTAVLNGADFLEDTILSVLSQNYPNLEYIIIDGGSTDGSVDIIKKYSEKLSYWVSEPDSGMYNAIQKGFSRSTGEIMAWLNSDDMYHPGALRSVAEIFDTFESVNWITGFTSLYDNQGRTHCVNPSRSFTKFDFMAGDYKWIQQESTFWRRSLWIRSGSSIDVGYKYAGDLFLWSKFFESDKLYTVSTLIGGFRIRGGTQLTSLYMDKYLIEANHVISKMSESSDEAKIVQGYKRLCKCFFRLRKFKYFDWIRLLKRYRRLYFNEPPTIRYDFENKQFVLSSSHFIFEHEID